MCLKKGIKKTPRKELLLFDFGAIQKNIYIAFVMYSITFTEKTQYIFLKREIYMSEIIKQDNRYTISGLMTHPDLKLKGVELKVYAIISGMSQGSGQYFTGSLEYLMALSGASKNSVLNALASLEAKQLITKSLMADYRIGFKTRQIELEESSVRKVKNHHYFTVWGWMVSHEGLGLKGLELNVYALVYMLSQGEGQFCTASTRYLGEFAGATDRAVRKVLVTLWQKGLVKRVTIGVNRYIYKALIPERARKAEKESKNSALNPKSSALNPKSSDIYKDKNKAINKCDKGRPQFNDFSQRSYDFGELEAALLNRQLC